MTNPTGLRAPEDFQCSNAALLVVLSAETEAAPPQSHHAHLVFLAQSLNTNEVLAALQQGSLIARGEVPTCEPAWARTAGQEMAEAVLRAVAVVLVGVKRYARQKALEFAVLDAFSARGEELEEAQDALQLAPPAAWELLSAAGLSPELGGDWWCDPYCEMVSDTN